MRKREIIPLLLVAGIIFLLTPCRGSAGTLSPPVPSLSATEAGFLITWNADPDDSVVYKIFWGNDDSVGEANYAGIISTSQTAFEHTGLTPGDSYHYRIKACSCQCGELSDVVSAVFEPAPADIHILSGRITIPGMTIQPDADPKITGTIRAVEATGANPGSSVPVNPDGTYRMALFTGTYNISVDLSVWEDNISFSSWGYPGPHDLPIDADKVQDIEMPLQALIGRVEDEEGKGVAGVDLRYSNGTARSDSVGEYKLYFLPGTYSLEANPPAGTRFGPAALEVVVPGSLSTIVLQTWPLLSGKITVNGAAIQPESLDQTLTATVRAVDVEGGRQVNSVTADPDGTYRMALLPGTYNLLVDLWLGEYWHGTYTTFNAWEYPVAQSVSVQADMVQHIDMPLYAVSGSVQDSDNQPVADAALNYANGATTTSAEDGYGGKFKLYFMAGSYCLEARPPAGSRFGPTAATVVVPGSAPTILLETLPLLSGKITVNGAAIQSERIRATVRAVDVTGVKPGGRVTADADGNYQMALLPGNYNISADLWIGEPWHGTYISFGASGHPGPQNLAIAGDAVQDIDIPLYALTGTVKDGDGQAVAAVELRYPNGAAKTSAEAGFEGAYKLYFAAGTYDLQIIAPPALFPPFQVHGIEITADTRRDIVLGQSQSTLPGAVPNQPPVAAAGGPYSGTAGTPVVLDAGDCFDADGNIVLYEWDCDNDGVFEQSTSQPSITHTWSAAYDGTVRLRVTDDRRSVEIDCTSATVTDSAPPDNIILSVDKDTLWPPNHKMVPVAVDVTGLNNPQASCHIASVSSNEPEEGRSDGRHAPDWQTTGDLIVDLRAERSGTGNGRTYTITVECTDESARSAGGTIEVTVPHDQGRRNGK